MGGCASKNKKAPKEEPYKPANAPKDKEAVEELVEGEKQAATNAAPVKQNGSASDFRNSLVGPGGVILPNQPNSKDEADPSIPFIDDIQDEADKQSKALAAKAAAAKDSVQAEVAAGVESVKAEVAAGADKAKTAVAAGADKAKAAVTAGIQEVGDKAETAKQTASSEIKKVTTTVTEKVSDGENLVTSVFKEVKTEVSSSESPIKTEDIKVTMTEKVEDAKTAAQDFVQSGVDKAESAADEAKSAAQPFVEKVQSFSMSSTVSSVTSTVSSVKTEFSGFRVVESDDSKPAKDEDVTKLCESVGFLYSQHYSGIGFRVGDKYIMTSQHIIKNILDKIVPEGGPDAEQKLLKNNEVWIQFNYLQMGEYELDNPTRFQFANITYMNKTLDVAIIELDTPAGKTIPPPLASFGTLENGSKVEFLGHNGAPSKRRSPVSQICPPTSDEIRLASALCKALSNGEDSFKGLEETDRVRFQQPFAFNVCGSPGIVLKDEDLVVVAMLTKNYPPFLHELDDQKKIPENLQVDEGVTMLSVYKALKEQEQTSELSNNIFGQALSSES